MKRIALTGIGVLLCGAPAMAQQIPRSVQTISFLDGDQFLVNAPHRWVVGSTNHLLEVPPGFVTDYASIPESARSIFERQGRYSRAAVIHDYLYWAQTCTRLQSDNLFLIAMKESGVAQVQREAIYRAVRLGGGAAWNANQRERREGNPRVVPEPYYGLVDGMTWPAARRVLFQRGVRDPRFVPNPRFCALGNSTDVP